MNKHYPQRAEVLTCRGRNGETRQFYPMVFREDVVNAVGVEGVFGFAIPLAKLRGLGPVCSIANRFGEILEHGSEIEIPDVPPTASSMGPLHIFLHIPKTAGTSLRNTLLRSVPAGEVLFVYPGRTPGIDGSEFHRVPLHQRNGLSWIFGHCHFGMDRHVTKTSKYITFVRDPVARLRSNVTHHLVYNTEFEFNDTRVSLATIVNEGLSEEFDNVMTRVLTGLGRDQVALGQIGEDEVDLAVKNVRQHFCFVGQQSSASADTKLLQTCLGLPIEDLSFDNITPYLADTSEIKMLHWNKIFDRNRPDQILYARLEREGLLSNVITTPVSNESFQ